jgi:hypothetical protein
VVCFGSHIYSAASYRHAYVNILTPPPPPRNSSPSVDERRPPILHDNTARHAHAGRYVIVPPPSRKASPHWYEAQERQALGRLGIERLRSDPWSFEFSRGRHPECLASLAPFRAARRAPPSFLCVSRLVLAEQMVGGRIART